MEIHVKVVGWLHIALSALLLLVAGVVFLLVFGGGLISGDHTAIFVTFLVSIFVSGLLVLVAAPGLIAGIGLLQFKPWARILALVLAVFDLLNFPLGTLLGIYTFIALLSDQGARLFQPMPDAAGSAAALPALASARRRPDQRGHNRPAARAACCNHSSARAIPRGNDGPAA